MAIVITDAEGREVLTVRCTEAVGTLMNPPAGTAGVDHAYGGEKRRIFYSRYERQLFATPTVSAIRAPRAPNGWRGPWVVSLAV
jgi:hypothetical protein